MNDTRLEKTVKAAIKQVVKTVKQVVKTVLQSAALCGVCYSAQSACVDSLPHSTPTAYFMTQSTIAYDATSTLKGLEGQSLGEAEVYDQSTGLIWQRCSVGQAWHNETNQCVLEPGAPFLFTWDAAQQKALLDPGWRIPSKIELLSLVERACTGPAINEEIFPDTPYQGFWTSDTPRALSTHQWVVNFKTGSLETIEKSRNLSLRLVKVPTKKDTHIE